MLRYLIGILFLGVSFSLNAQVLSSSNQEIESSLQQRKTLFENSIFKDYPVRSVGPVVMGGRVTAIAVHPENPRIFYTGFGSGGVFKTTNSGNTMTPIFDHQGGALGIGALALSTANPDIIWVGTGENNASRSTYAGTGVYKSSDAGESWTFTGLRNSQHIGRIVTHPTDENIAWVASVGALYSPNAERGVYKTLDGGETWNQVLFINDSTGVIDLIIHPEDPTQLWAAAWEKDRKAWNFKEGGVGSGVYHSADGGETWQKVTNGLPDGPFVGRIGLDISKSDPNVLYAVIDNQFETKTERSHSEDNYTQSTFLTITKAEFVNLDDSKLNTYLRRNGFPSEFDAAKVKGDVAEGIYEPKALSEYVSDANSALFNTEIIGPEVYRSDDGGISWKKVNSYDLDGVFYTYGYYFGRIHVDPNDAETIYIYGVPVIKSTDGGKTWEVKADNQSVHSDHHDLWIDPTDSEHLLLGNDGGLYESHDGGENFIHHNVAPTAQFYAVSVDMETPYNIYGGMQDNGTFFGPSTSSGNRERPWKRLFGGDGMHVYPKPGNPEVVYVGFQYGNYYRIDQENGQSNSITPKQNVGEPRFRYNWNSPISISSHHPDIIYFGSQKLMRSMDEGKTWTALSGDLTNDLPNGDVPYSTLTTIAESPLSFNVIWVGTDDGNIQVTRDGGVSWTIVSGYLPQGRWVSEIHASAYDEATAYVSLNGYRNDEFKTYIYKTTDFGSTWTSLKGNLPDDVVNVILQDPTKPEILYAGLDHGTYVSFDQGVKWHYLASIPNVATYDMVVHPRDLDLVIGTHGRSIYVMDTEPLYQVADRLEEPITATTPSSIRFSNRWGNQSTEYRDPYMPEVDLVYFLSNEDGGRVTIDIKNSNGAKLAEIKTEGQYGFNTYSWNLVKRKTDDGFEFFEKGTYTLTFKTGRSSHDVSFEIK